MYGTFDSHDAQAALSRLCELDNSYLQLDPSSPRKTADSLAAIFDILDGLDLLTARSSSSVEKEITLLFELAEKDTERVIADLKILAPYLPDRYTVSARARQWAEGIVEETASDTIADVLYATNRWNVVVPGVGVEFPSGCICCGDPSADQVPITSSKTFRFEESHYITHTKTASVFNAYEVCDFCSRHFDKFRTRQLLAIGVPIVSGICAFLGLVAGGFWISEPAHTVAHSVFGWTSFVVLTTALSLYLAGRHTRSRWNNEESGLKPACRSATCPIKVELVTSPLRWKTKASLQDVMEAPDGITEQVSGTDIDANTKLFVWISGFSDIESYAREVSALNRNSEVVRAVLE